MWRHPLGEVSGGTDATTGARVQVLALNAGTVASDALLEAARAATRVAASVTSPAVVKPIDVQRMPDGRIAIATEALEGTPLTNVSRNQPLPVNRTVAVLRQLCRALAAVHEVGLVHRALTLGSLVLRARTDKPDTVAVTDFGVGPLLEGEIVVLKEDASLQPVSPERISGVQQDEREDQYLMGCIAYSLFTGGAPFRTGAPDAVRRRHAIEDPMQISDRLKGTRGVHPALAAWVHRCLAKEPDDRFEDILQCEAALCLAQIEAHVQTPWDDLPAPDVDAATAARITAGMRRSAVPSPATAEPEDDVTVLRRPTDPTPEGQTTIVRSYDAEPVEMPDDVGSVPIRVADLDAIDRGDTVVTHADDTVAGSLPQANEETAIGRLEAPAAMPAEDDPREQTRRTEIPDEETTVGNAPRDDTVTTAAPMPTRARAPALAPAPAPAPAREPVPDLDLGLDSDAADRTQVSTIPAKPFQPAPVVAHAIEPAPEPADRTSVAPPAVVRFTPATPTVIPARAPSSTPTVPAGMSIDPRLLPSSTSTLPGGTAPPRVAAPPVETFDDDPFAEEPTIPPAMPAAAPAPIAPPVAAPPPVVAAPPAPAPPAPAPPAPAPQVPAPAPIAAPPIAAAAPIAAPQPVVAPPAPAPGPPAPAPPPVASAPAFTPPLPIAPAVMPPQVVPVTIERPWPAGPTGLTGQYTTTNASFSQSDMDASMIASIGGGNRTLKLVLIVLAVASIVAVGFYYVLRPPPEPPPAPVVAEPAPPVKIEKVTPVVDDIAADVAATPNDLVAAGDRAAGEGRAKDAEALYQRAIVREPKHLGALLGLGRLQLAANDVEKAASYFRRAVGANPNDGAARIALGDALVQQGNLAEAKKQYRKAKSLKHPDAAGRLSSL